METRFPASAQPEAPPTAVMVVLDVPEAASHVALVRKAVRDLFGGRGVSESDTSDLETVVTELATNAVRHAKSGGNYQVHIGLSAGEASVTVADDGGGFDPDAVPEPGTVRPDGEVGEEMWRIGGFGLPLVYALADHVSIERKLPRGMVVRARKRVRLSPASRLPV